jgi:hypothetical protein
MQLTLARWATGLALLTTLVAGCSAAGTSHAPVAAQASKSPVPTATHVATPARAHVPATPAVRHHRRRHHRTTVPTVTAPPAPPVTMLAIPQDNGGDHDADNNGGPIDGDGNI